jgi:hypothetical protein
LVFELRSSQARKIGQVTAIIGTIITEEANSGTETVKNVGLDPSAACVVDIATNGKLVVNVGGRNINGLTNITVDAARILVGEGININDSIQSFQPIQVRVHKHQITEVINAIGINV